MATRDYANRKPRAKKGSASSHRNKAAPKRRLPVVLTAVVTVAIAGFCYFLWQLKDSPKPEAAPVEVSKPVATTPAKKDPNALPPKPKEEWTYQQALENKKVEVEIPIQDEPAPRPHEIQCASFRLQSQADTLRAKMAFQGLEAHVREVKGTTGLWYKVVLGPFPSKRDAESKRHALQRASINGCILIRL